MKLCRTALYAVTLLLLTGSIMSAQSESTLLTGVVIDSATGSPLAAAGVRLVEIHREVRTHEDGTFTFGLIPDGLYELTVHRIGYRSASRTLEARGGSVTVRIVLQPAPMQLSRTVVTGQIRERGAADAISSSSVLSDARLDRSLDGTLGATVAGVPGVAVASMGPATARPVLRGMSGDRVLILEDGMRSGDLSSTSMDHAVAIDPLTARKVEVVRGPMSLIYGSSALGGVVNLIRNEVPTTRVDHLHGTLSVQGSSVNDGATVGGFVEAPAKGFTVRGEGSFRKAGDIRTPVGRLGNTSVQTVGAAFGASAVRDWGYTGLSYRYFGNEYGLPGGFVGAHPNGVDISMRRYMVRSETDWHPSVGFLDGVKATVGFSDYLHDEMTRSGAIATRFEQQMTAAEVVARHREIGPFSNGAVGVRAQYRDITTAGALRTPSTADWSAAAFVVQEAGTGALRFQVGARYDLARFIPLERTFVTVNSVQIPTEPRTFGAFSGSAGALYRFENDVRIGASVSRSYRTPDFNELYSDGPHLAAYSYDVGNPEINQETGLGFDAFVRIERENFRGEIAGFANRMKGYLFPRNTGELGRQGMRWKFQYSNEDALLAGAEGEAEWMLSEHFVVEVSGSYVQGTLLGTRDTIPGVDGEPDHLESKYLPLIPPLNGRVGFRHDTPRWSYGAGVKMAAAQNQLGDYETSTASYATGDIHIGWRGLVAGKLHGVTLRVENVLDAEIREHLSRTKEILPESGRNISLLYRFQF